MIGTVPTETSTQAFNANSVAAVYISSGYGDLATKSEAGVGKTSVFENEALSLQNGIYGMSDPANLRGMVERFEVELTQGGTSKGTYRIRLINPTDELEVFLFGIYNAAFPNSNTPFEMYAKAAEENVAVTTVNAVDESNPLKDLLSRGMQLPFLYLRWGYGTSEEEGLSRIHKCVLVDCEYSISNNKDKVIELHLVDWFSSLAGNQTFNIAPHVTEQNCLDDAKQLRGFGSILGDLIVKYSGVFPGVYPVYDSKSLNMVKLDVLANNLAVTDYRLLLEYQKESSVGEPGKFTGTGTVEDVAAAIAGGVLKVPDTLEQGKDFSTGDELSDSNKIWVDAYSKVFKFLGINQRHTSEIVNMDPVTIDNTEFTPPDSRSTLGAAFNNLKNDATISIVEIGLLDFIIPVWETPNLKFPPLVTDPMVLGQGTMMSTPLQSFSTPRLINYNPSLDMMVEMYNNPKMPHGGFVMGWLSRLNRTRDARLNSLTTSQEYYLKNVRNPAATITFTELEQVVASLRKLVKDYIIPRKPVYPNSDAFKLLPRALLLLNSFIAPDPNKGQPAYMFSESGSLSLDEQYLLYTPLATATTVDIPSDLVLGSVGTFQTRGLPTKPGVGLINKPTVHIGDDYNIGNFGVKSYSFSPFISLIPSPPAIALLEQKFLQMQISILAEAQETIIATTHELTDFQISQSTDVISHNKAWRKVVATRDIVGGQSHSVTAFLGTGNSTTPHITGVLIELITAINKLVVGEKDKFVVQQLDLNSLTPENFTDLFKPTGLISSLEGGDAVKDLIRKNKPMLLMIGRSSWLGTTFNNRLTSKVHSFPEITRTEEDLQDYLFLSYGQKDSIVTDLRFMGDIRTLYNIPRAFYATKQFADLKGFFKTADQDETNKMIADLIVFIHQNRTESKLTATKNLLTITATDADEAVNARVERDDILKERLELEAITAIDYMSHKEYLDHFPTLITEFTNEQLTAGGFKDPIAARKVASILGSKEFTELLFPVVEYYDSSFKGVLGLGLQSGGMNRLKQHRQLNVASFYNSLEELEAASIDAKMNYVKNSQNESWQVEISTLGIPEIDIMGAEFFARRIVLSVNTPRGGTTSAGAQGFHWLSGVYAIAGIKHELEPGSGFRTSLSLIKIPAATLPNYA